MKKKLAWKNPFFIIPFCILLSISLLLMIHAGYISDIYANSFEKQLLWFIIGLVVLFVMKFFPINWLFKNSIFLYIFNLLLLILVLFIGEEINGARAWIDLHYFNIQPSELAKIIIIMFLAIYYDKHKDELDNQWILIKPLILCIIIFLLVAIQPDLGTAGIIALLTIIMFYGVPMTKKTRNIYNKIFLGGILVILSILLVTGGSFLRGYQAERLNFKDPCERYQEDSGYQLCNSFIAFKNGGLTGQGIGESTQKYLYLPESYTDFIFPIIVEECGLIIGIIILIMYMILLYRIIRIAKKATNIHNSLISYGIFAYVFLHILVNLGGVMGLIPLTGVPLPYLSYGGSYTICLMVAIALVERVAIETNIKKEKSAKK